MESTSLHPLSPSKELSPPRRRTRASLGAALSAPTDSESELPHAHLPLSYFDLQRAISSADETGEIVGHRRRNSSVLWPPSGRRTPDYTPPRSPVRRAESADYERVFSVHTADFHLKSDRQLLDLLGPLPSSKPSNQSILPQPATTRVSPIPSPPAQTILEEPLLTPRTTHSTLSQPSSQLLGFPFPDTPPATSAGASPRFPVPPSALQLIRALSSALAAARASAVAQAEEVDALAELAKQHGASEGEVERVLRRVRTDRPGAPPVRRTGSKGSGRRARREGKARKAGRASEDGPGAVVETGGEGDDEALPPHQSALNESLRDAMSSTAFRPPPAALSESLSHSPSGPSDPSTRLASYSPASLPVRIPTTASSPARAKTKARSGSMRSNASEASASGGGGWLGWTAGIWGGGGGSSRAGSSAPEDRLSVSGPTAADEGVHAGSPSASTTASTSTKRSVMSSLGLKRSSRSKPPPPTTPSSSAIADNSASDVPPLTPTSDMTTPAHASADRRTSISSRRTSRSRSRSESISSGFAPTAAAVPPPTSAPPALTLEPPTSPPADIPDPPPRHHPSHFRAIFLATRLATDRPNSILADAASPLVSRLAMRLVADTREQGIVLRDEKPSPSPTATSAGGAGLAVSPNAIRTGAPKASVTPAELAGSPVHSPPTGAALGSREHSSSRVSDTLVKATLGRALAKDHQHHRPGGLSDLPAFARASPEPAAGAGVSGSASPGSSGGTAGGAGAGAGTAKAAPPSNLSMELEPIVPAAFKPPTFSLARSHRNRPASYVPPDVARSSSARFDAELVDKYGFIYKPTLADVKLLRDAARASNPAPTCATGVRPQLESDEDDVGSVRSWLMREEPGMLREVDEEEDDKQDQEAAASQARRPRSTSAGPLLDPQPVQPSVEPQAVHATADALSPMDEHPELDLSATTTSTSTNTVASSLKSAASSITTSEKAPAATSSASAVPRSFVQRLLRQLTDKFDARQAEQLEAWDEFLKRRRDALSAASSTSRPSGSGAGGGEAKASGILAKSGLALRPLDGDDEDASWRDRLIGINSIGLDGQGRDELDRFQRLVRGGIPLCYRAKVWAECSGAVDLQEPGTYQELLERHEGETPQCIAEIDRDITRTMPTNIFFGGNGPGVEKLRRVLVAYSWRNPEVGYCQGMNLIAATLLLTIPTEEDCFWVLACIIEHVLPSDYMSPSLLVSQADQRVLLQLVERLLPKVHAHLVNHGIQLPAITFGWFLSVFTDCLPLETLYRVWDVLFVEGVDVLFRVALAMLKMNEAAILSHDSEVTLYSFLTSMTGQLCNADQLLKIACDDFPSVQYSDISRMREVAVRELQLEQHQADGEDVDEGAV